MAYPVLFSFQKLHAMQLYMFAPVCTPFWSFWLCCNVCDFWGFNSVIHAAAAAGKPGILAVFAEDFLTERWGEDSEAGTSWILARTGKHWVGHLSTFVCLEVRVCGSWLTWARQKLPQDRLMWFKSQCDGDATSSKVLDTMCIFVYSLSNMMRSFFCKDLVDFLNLLASVGHCSHSPAADSLGHSSWNSKRWWSLTWHWCYDINIYILLL